MSVHEPYSASDVLVSFFFFSVAYIAQTTHASDPHACRAHTATVPMKARARRENVCSKEDVKRTPHKKKEH